MNDEQEMRSRLQRSVFSVQRSFVRWAFARFYREFAWTYDTVAAAVSGGRWFDWGRAALPHLRGQVLELGCGTGQLQRALAEWPGVTRAAALDASPQMLAIAGHKLTQANLPLRLVRGIAQALPFAPRSFDAAVATFPSEYITDPATLNEVRRVLRPGGQMVIVLAASFGEQGAYQRAVDLLYRVTLQRSPALPPAASPNSHFGRRLAEHGFAVEERWEPAAGGHVHLIVARVT